VPGTFRRNSACAWRNRDSAVCRDKKLSAKPPYTFVTRPVSYSNVTGGYFSVKSDWGVQLISDLRLEPCLRIRRAVPPLSHKPSCRGA